MSVTTKGDPGSVGIFPGKKDPARSEDVDIHFRIDTTHIIGTMIHLLLGLVIGFHLAALFIKWQQSGLFCDNTDIFSQRWKMQGFMISINEESGDLTS